MCISGFYRCIEFCTAFWQRITEKEFGNFIDCYAVAVKKIPVVMLPQDLKTHSEVIMLAS